MSFSSIPRLSAIFSVVALKLRFLTHAPKREYRRAGIVIIAIAVFGWMFNTHFGLYLDLSEIRCMPEHLYAGYPRTDAPLKAGDVVSFKASNRVMLDLMTGKRIAKIVAATAGDHVVSNENGVWINGKPVLERNPISLEKLAEKHKTPVNLNKVLEPGELFVIGTLPRSFDSRYWGVLPERYVDRKVLPIL